VTEAFLHYIWQFQYFSKEDLRTSEGDLLEIFHPGIANSNAGPDFSNARIKIENLEWRGSVEIHIKASGWSDHQHSSDEAYEKVVLHVVWENDRSIFHSDGSPIPTLELKGRVATEQWTRYKNLISNPESIPCSNHWIKVPDLSKLAMLDKAVAIRLQSKSKIIEATLAKTHGDWEETCYRVLCKNFGFKVNADAMEQLAETISYKTILKSSDKPYHIEALLLGQAGFLEKSSKDEYILLLKREFTLLSKKFNLEGKQMREAQWRFLRLRPANFPTIRLAQLAALFSMHTNLFSKILACKTSKELTELFHVTQSEYWIEHYQVDKPSAANIDGLGKSSIQNLIINTVAPLLTAYGKLHDDQNYVDRAIDLLQNTPSENNKITRQWNELGFKVKTAFDSQGLIELHNSYCIKRRCLECTVGMHIVNKL
jgi:arsenate reductase-like glutaredoxin family protein